MALSDLHPAERHRQIAAGFTDRVRGTKHWHAASPVAGWTARDVVRHLIEWLPSFLVAGGADAGRPAPAHPGASVELPNGPSVDDDPVTAWQAHCAWVQALLDDPETPQRLLVNRHIGEVPLDQAIDRFYTSDVFMHTWDLARATGQHDRIDPDQCAVLLAEMEQIEDAIRSSGQYGPPVPTPEGADTQTRMLGFIGRDPFWTPARAGG